MNKSIDFYRKLNVRIPIYVLHRKELEKTIFLFVFYKENRIERVAVVPVETNRFDFMTFTLSQTVYNTCMLYIILFCVGPFYLFNLVLQSMKGMRHYMWVLLYYISSNLYVIILKYYFYIFLHATVVT